jgi:hypothetical protein
MFTRPERPSGARPEPGKSVIRVTVVANAGRHRAGLDLACTLRKR